MDWSYLSKLFQLVLYWIRLVLTFISVFRDHGHGGLGHPPVLEQGRIRGCPHQRSHCKSFSRPFGVYPAAKYSPRTGPTILPGRVFTQPVEQLLKNEFRQDKKAQYPTWTVHLCIGEHFSKDWRVKREGKTQKGTAPVKEENKSLGLPLILPTRKRSFADMSPKMSGALLERSSVENSPSSVSSSFIEDGEEWLANVLTGNEHHHEETSTSALPTPENEKEKGDQQLDAPAARTRGIKQRRR